MTQYFNLNEHTMQAHPMDLVGAVNPATLAKGLKRSQVGNFEVMSIFTGVDRLTTVWRGEILEIAGPFAVEIFYRREPVEELNQTFADAAQMDQYHRDACALIESITEQFKATMGSPGFTGYWRGASGCPAWWPNSRHLRQAEIWRI